VLMMVWRPQGIVTRDLIERIAFWRGRARLPATESPGG
jgi:hypothetical protein